MRVFNEHIWIAELRSLGILFVPSGAHELLSCLRIIEYYRLRASCVQADDLAVKTRTLRAI